MSMRPNRWFHYPNLDEGNHRETSPPSTAYNCVSWIAEETERQWQPSSDPSDAYWPPGITREDTLASYLSAFEFLGFEPCLDGEFEPGVQKIAIYTDSQNMFTHVAIQRTEAPEWSSKLGTWEDISHTTLDALSGWLYGQASFFMERPISS